MKTERVLQPRMINDIPEVSPEELRAHTKAVQIIDVRRDEEFNNELGHIAGAKLVTLGDSLFKFLESGDRNQEIVFVCRSGGRSGQATLYSHSLGYEKTVNMTGGMLRWNELQLPTERNLVNI